MKKNINSIFRKATLFSLIAMSLVACDNNEEPDYAASSVNKPTVSVEFGSYSITEAETAVVNLMLDHSFNTDVSYRLSIVDGNTAIDNEDFVVLASDGSELPHYLDASYADYAPYEMGDPDALTYGVVVPAFSSTFTINVAGLIDDVDGDVKSVTFRLTPAGNYNGLVNEEASEFTVNISNFDVTPVDFTFSWNRDFNHMGFTFSLDDIGYDMDYLWASEDFSSIDYFSDSQAATGDSPETLTFDPANPNIPDFEIGATYHIIQNIYEDGDLSSVGVSPSFLIPTTIDYSRSGNSGTIGSGTYVQADADAPSSDDGDMNASYLGYVVSFKVDASGVFTLFDYYTDEVIASGKNSNSFNKKEIMNKVNFLRKQKNNVTAPKVKLTK